jgi:four helix bundle protein
MLICPGMTGDDLRDRTRKFSLEIVDLCDALPSLPTVLLVRNQLFRAGTGVGANYRSACRSRSRKEFISRVAVALEEADECEFWLDVLEHRRTGNAAAVKRLRQEAGELRAILAASRRTAIRNLRKAQEMDAV